MQTGTRGTVSGRNNILDMFIIRRENKDIWISTHLLTCRIRRFSSFSMHNDLSGRPEKVRDILKRGKRESVDED